MKLISVSKVKSPLSAVPVISDYALAEFDAEIERDRKAGRLVKLGDTPKEAVAALRRLGRKRN